MEPIHAARIWQALHQRFRAFNPIAQYPRFGLIGGLLLVSMLVPILQSWRGTAGPLGQSIPLFFLVPVLLASVVGGQGTGVVVSCAAIFVWDWFFIEPRYTVSIASARDVLALAVFLLVALLVGQLSTAARRHAEEALRRARSSEALYELSMALIRGRSLDDVLPTLTQRLRETFDLQACAVLLPTPQGDGWRTVAIAGRLPNGLRVEQSRDLATTATQVQVRNKEYVIGHLRRELGRSERTVRPRPGQERARFLPLQVATRAIGVLEVVPSAHQKPDIEREHLLTTFANGAALALEQARLTQEEQAATLARESDRLKSALLSSVSHDLRTPLAGIKAAASSLLQSDVTWSEQDRRAFLQDIDHEADRLTRLVSNLLDLSRIEAGAIQPAKDWEDVAELIDRLLTRLAPRLGDHQLIQHVASDVPAVRLDVVQIEQVLTNLLENAAKYSPAGTPITISAHLVTTRDGTPQIEIAVADHGIGIAHGEQDRVFDKFYRITGGTRGQSGTGMGLAIVKGLVEAHDGTVQLTSTPGQGSTFRILLPLNDRHERVQAADTPPAVTQPR